MARTKTVHSKKTESVNDDDRRLGGIVSWVFLVGLTAAIALLLVGVVLALARPEAPRIHESSLSDLSRELQAGESGGFFQLGILVLLAGPVAALVVIGASFALRRRWRFAAIALVVLAVLALSALLGLRG